MSKNATPDTGRSRFEDVTAYLKARLGDAATREEPGWWTFDIKTVHSRSQIVNFYLVPETADSRDKGVRVAIVSPVGRTHPQMRYDDLLRRNARLQCGAICIEDLREPSGNVVSFVTVRCTADAASLDERDVLDTIKRVGTMADELEHEMSALDIY